MTEQARSFIPDDPLESDIPDELAASDIAGMASKQRIAEETGQYTQAPEAKVATDTEVARPKKQFKKQVIEDVVPSSFQPDEETGPSSFEPDSFAPDQKGPYAVPSPDPSTWERVKGAYLTASDIGSNFANWMSDIVRGESIDPATGEKLGKDKARELRVFSQEREKEKYTYEGQEYGFPEFIGGAGRTLTDPLSIVTMPVGGGGGILNMGRLAKLAGVGGAIGATESATEQLADTGEISDPGSVFQRGIQGAVILPAGDVLIRSGGKLVKLGMEKTGTSDKIATYFNKIATRNKAINDAYTPKQLETFNKTLDDLQDEAIFQASRGNIGANSVLDAELRLGLHPDQTMLMLEATGRQLTVPNQDEAIKLVRMSDIGRKDIVDWQNNWANNAFTAVSTSLREIEPRVGNAVRKMEYFRRMKFHERITGIDDFINNVNKLPRPLAKTVDNALMDGDFDMVRNVFKGRKDFEGLTQFNKAIKEFEKQAVALKDVYPDIKLRDNYWPRVLKDRDGFLTVLDKKQKSLFENAVAKLETKLGRKPDAWMEAEVAMNLLKDGRPRLSAPSSIKQRKWKTVPDKFRQYFAPFNVAAHMYFYRTTDDIAKREMFGRAIRYTDKTRKTVDLNKTIGAYIADNSRLRKSDAAYHELQRLLKLRFIEGEQRPHQVMRVLRDVTYGTTLSNLWADLTQFKDVGNVMARYGMGDTLKSIGDAVRGKTSWKAADMALTDITAELEHSPSVTTRLVEKSLKYHGFQKADIMGKSLAMNAAWNKNVRLANTEKGAKEIYNKYAKAMGQDVFNLIDDLKAGRKNDRTGFFIFHELSDMQPISLSEMPPKWLQNPNGRILYALRSFSLKQLNVIIDDVVRQRIRKGDVVGGLKMAARYAVYLSAAGISINTIKDMLKGKEVTLDDMPEYAMDNLMATFGASQYMIDQLGRNKPEDVYGNIMDPAFVGIASTVYKDISRNIKKHEDDSRLDPEKLYFDSSKYLGGPGSFYYWWVGGGKERVEKRNEEKENEE